MKEKNPLVEEKPSNEIDSLVPEKKIPQNPEDSKKEIRPQKIIKKKSKESNKNNNKKSSELNININISSEDELEHPLPLLSDYNEEGKDEIKSDFFKNKLKEREKNTEKKEKNPKLQKIVENNENPIKNKVIKVMNSNNAIKKEKSIEYQDILDNIAPPPVESIDLGQNLKNYYSNSLSEIKMKAKKEQIREIGKGERIIILPQQKESIKSEQSQIKEEEINKENINDIYNAQDKCLTDIKIKPKLTDHVNHSHQKSNQIKNQKSKNSSQLKNIAQKNYVNLKKPSHKIVRKPINLNPHSNNSINNDIHEEIYQSQKTISIPQKVPKKILKIRNIKDKNIINKNYEINTFENKENDNRDINIEKSNPFAIQNNSQVFRNLNHIKNSKTHNEHQAKKKKSQSFSSIPLNKRFYDTASKLNKNVNMNSRENYLSKEKMMNSQQTFNFENSPMKNMQQKTNDFRTFQKNKKINKIPLPINHQKYSSSQINKKDLNISQPNINNFSSNIKPKINFSCSNINSDKKISNIHNNNNFYSRFDDQKENFQDNSQYQKQTYDNGGKFNNIQTTYVVISKNSNSKLKLIPKNAKTIEYENNRYLNINQSEIYSKTSKGLPPEQNIPSSNTEKKVYINNNYNYYPPYIEGQNTIPKTNSMIQRLIRIHKSQNDIHIKKNYDSVNQSIELNNYGFSYRTNMSNMSNMDYSSLNNKAQTINFQNRNDYYLSNKPIAKRTKRFDDFDNFYDYEGSQVSTETYGACSMNNNNYGY